MKSLNFVWFVLLQTCKFFLRFSISLSKDLERLNSKVLEWKCKLKYQNIWIKDFTVQYFSLQVHMHSSPPNVFQVKSWKLSHKRVSLH